MSSAFSPALMRPDLAARLTSEGYHLPESWPCNARVAPEMNARAGWSVSTAGTIKAEPVTVYVAPDGSKWTPAKNGARPVLVGLSKRTGPVALRVLPGSRRPKWVIADTPKGEIPDALRAYLLKPGQKLSKGQRREAEAFAVEPLEAVRAMPIGRATRGAVKAVLGSEPRHDKTARREWTRRYNALRKERVAGAAR